MTNSTCLAGMPCPNEKCQNYGPFQIQCGMICRVTDDGIAEHDDDSDWDNESFCACHGCEFIGTAADFTVKAGAP